MTKSPLVKSVGALIAIMVIVGCSDAAAPAPASASKSAEPAPVTCACSDDQICRDGACREPDARALAQTAALSALLRESRTVGATSAPVDYDALEKTLRRELFAGDGSTRTYARTLWRGMLALPQGHQLLAPKKTAYADFEAAGFTMGSLTRYGACLRPYSDHAVVTYSDRRTTDLRRGDEIVAIDGKRGDALIDELLAQPQGADYLPPTRAGRFALAIKNWFSLERANAVLTIRRAGSASEIDVTLPKALPPEKGSGCDDAFGRDYSKPALGKVGSDGTGVLYIPGFAQRSVDDFETEVGPAFDQVKGAARLVIDLRGNGGGLLQSALRFVSQLPGAKKTSYCEFFERAPKSEPPAFVSDGARAVDPAAVPQPARFAFAGKVAILVDGATHSAAEHFALAAKLGTSAVVVGTPTAGAFGTVTKDVARVLEGEPRLSVTMNRSQVRSTDGTRLDGTSVTPHVEVGYEPAALADGRDPMLDRAIEELGR